MQEVQEEDSLVTFKPMVMLTLAVDRYSIHLMYTSCVHQHYFHADKQHYCHL
jgi:hypothetical protein